MFFEIAPENVALVFDRRVFDSYRDEKLPEDEELGGLFFRFVEHRLLSDETKAFGIVRKVGEKYGNLDRLSAQGKDALISCGERFAREEDWPSVFWIIEQLKNDADPPFPNSMHDEIVKGKDYSLIVSVRGRLCWLMQKVVVHNLIEHYSPMLDILEGYAFGKICISAPKRVCHYLKWLFAGDKNSRTVAGLCLKTLPNASRRLHFACYWMRAGIQLCSMT